MFQATFIGHQGWLLQAESTRLLVDPLLEETFGNTPGVALQVYPPRELRHGDFPPISAVLLTHEHEDHLHLASLDRLSRDIPIYLDWFRTGKLDLNALVTRRYRLDQGAEALRALEAGEILGRAVIAFDDPAARA